MTSALGGRRSKSEGLTQNMDRGSLTRTERVALQALEAEEKRLAKKMKDEGDDADASDTSMAYQMLRDLRAAYKRGKGKDKLKTMMESDADFRFLIKELLRVEVAIMAAKIRRDGDGQGSGSGQAVYVVLKGLECEKPLVNAMEKNLAIDIEQVKAAINPEEGAAKWEDKAPSSTERPAEIVKILAGVEDE